MKEQRATKKANAKDGKAAKKTPAKKVGGRSMHKVSSRSGTILLCAIYCEVQYDERIRLLTHRSQPRRPRRMRLRVSTCHVFNVG